MLGASLSELQFEDLGRLVSEQASEGLQLEFKASVNLASDEGRSELVEDIVAFANAAGGDLVIGIEEAVDPSGRRLGHAGALCGFAVGSADQFKLRLENALRDTVEPRLSGLEYRFVPLPSGLAVAVIRVPRSSHFHLVRKGSYYKAVGRNAAGKFPFDSAQLREGILRAQTLYERLSGFRYERLSRILIGEMPVSVVPRAKLVIHILPESAFRSGNPLAGERSSVNILVPKGPFTSLANTVPNFDGVLHWSRGMTNEAIAYLQTFRSGILEGVEAELSHERGSVFSLPSTIDGYILNGIHRYLDVARRIGSGPPVFVAVSLVGAKGSWIHPVTHNPSPGRIDREILMLPEVAIEDLSMPHKGLAQEFKVVLDILYQACGYQGSWNFDRDGLYTWPLGGDYVGGF